MKRFIRYLVLLLLIAPLTLGAETITWVAPKTFTDNTVIPASGLAQIEYFLYLVKEGNPTAMTYIGKAAGGATTWVDNILVQANAWASGANAPYQAAIPGWVVLKAGDNVLVTIHAFLNRATSAGSAPYKWTLPGGTVVVPAPTVTLAAAPASVATGACSTLTWSSTNATSVAIDQGVGTVAASGTKSVCPATTTTYSITAIGFGGTKVASATVTVTPIPIPTPMPGCNPPTGVTIKP